MTAQLAAGTTIDGFTLGERLHSGAMGNIYRVSGPGGGSTLIMKVPRVGPQEPTEAIISFETEATIVPVLTGPHVPRFVAAGDITRLPYLVTEWIDGVSLERLLSRGRMDGGSVASTGAAIADALHSLHQQDVIHLDVKPGNIIIRPDGTAALVDFGFAHHRRYPDLLDEETRAAGSAPYISPEQIARIRNDARSDLFALGVVLYEMATGRLPFGAPETSTGVRARLWMDPAPPRVAAPLQEVILRCLEPNAERRYQSAAHVAFDLRNPEQVELTARATKAKQAGYIEQTRRWWSARGRPARRVRLSEVPIVMIAVDTTHPDDERQPAIRLAARQILAASAEFRLVCVSVVRAMPMIDQPSESASGVHLEHLIRLRHWVEPLRLPPDRLSLHVIEAPDPADALLAFARANNVDRIVLGAPTPGLPGKSWWKSVASSVTANAHCTVHVVRSRG